jgi:hypothetical protein
VLASSAPPLERRASSVARRFGSLRGAVKAAGIADTPKRR